MEASAKNAEESPLLTPPNQSIPRPRSPHKEASLTPTSNKNLSCIAGMKSRGVNPEHGSAEGQDETGVLAAGGGAASCAVIDGRIPTFSATSPDPRHQSRGLGCFENSHATCNATTGFASYDRPRPRCSPQEICRFQGRDQTKHEINDLAWEFWICLVSCILQFPSSVSFFIPTSCRTVDISATARALCRT